MVDILRSSSSGALFVLALLTISSFFDNFDKYLIAVSPIPYIDYSSYEYSILSGPAFTIMYTLGGLFFTLGFPNDNLNAFDKKGWINKPNVLCFATVWFSAAFLITAFAENFWQQVIVRILMGLAQSVITPFASSIIRDYFPAEVSGSAFGIFNTALYLSFAFSLSLGLYIYITYGWRAGYIIFGIVGIAFAFTLPLIHFIPPPNHDELVHLNQSSLTSEMNSTNNIAQPLIASTTATTNTITDDTAAGGSNNPMLSNVSHSKKSKSDLDEDTVASSNSSNTVSYQESVKAMWQHMKDILYEVAYVHWWKQHPGIMVVSIATGLRLGGGYIWSAYTGVFFSDLFAYESDSIDCDYSYNAAVLSIPDGIQVCDSDYPYCVSGSCAAIAQFPWHNEGMDPLKVISYMSWTPICGSALGSLLGGFISDYLIKQHPNMHTNKRNPYVPLRALIAGVTCILSIPLVWGSFLLDSPGCFLIYIASGIIGEVYLGQTFALITDVHYIPKRLISSAVAVFMLVITVIGGNAPLLLPVIKEGIGYTNDVTLSFQAYGLYNASMITTGTLLPDTDSTISVTHEDAYRFQYAMLASLVGCYLSAGILYLVSYYMLMQEYQTTTTGTTKEEISVEVESTNKTWEEAE